MEKKSDIPNFYHNFSYVHSEWYEDFSQYHPLPDFISVVRGIVPLSWKWIPTGMWVHAAPPLQVLPAQGWKLHISALPQDCEEILGRCVDICVQYDVSFKFLSDARIFNIAMSKGWAREACGKFITFYPIDIRQFQTVADALCESLKEFKGPYVLSDRRYKGSQTVYYRYGAFHGYPKLQLTGEIEYLLRSPDGILVNDGRDAFFNPPDWVSDPFEESEITDTSENADANYLKDGQYQIDEALHFSMTGGIYKATDLKTNKTVVIKEARPHVSVSSNAIDAVERLKKEFRLLEKLSSTGITPQPLDFFQDWEHYFLVEEFIAGETLFARVPNCNTDRLGVEIPTTEKLLTIAINLAQAVQIVHEQNIVINDFSPSNIIVSEDNSQLHLIDFEAAWEVGVDIPVDDFGTVGFRPKSGISEIANDVYGLGALLLHVFVPINDLLELKPEAVKIFLDVPEASGRLPIGLKTLICDCLDKDKNKRPKVVEVLNRLKKMHYASSQPSRLDTDQNGISDAILTESLGKTLDYIKSNMSLNRKDRLFPADPHVFTTNPLSLANGASGVAYMFLTVEGKVPDKIISWMLSHEISQENYPPGLYVGLSGIAWVFWKLGLQEVALKIIRMAVNHPLLGESLDIYCGSAGFGLSCLFFYLQTKDAYWLEQAVKIGNKFVESRSEDDNGYYWLDIEGKVITGYAWGQSGIALFLLYLYLATGEARFKDSGRRALDYVLAQLQITPDGRYVIPVHFSDSVSSRNKEFAMPYWAYGSAGICTTLLRYFVAFQDDNNKSMLEQLILNTFGRSYAFSPSLEGLAGLGNLHLDAFQFIGDSHYLKEATQVAEAILRFQIEKPDGIAFPGKHLHRISTDFETGSSGIALFLHRLLNRTDIGNFNFVLDELLAESV